MAQSFFIKVRVTENGAVHRIKVFWVPSKPQKGSIRERLERGFGGKSYMLLYYVYTYDIKGRYERRYIDYDGEFYENRKVNIFIKSRSLRCTTSLQLPPIRDLLPKEFVITNANLNKNKDRKRKQQNKQK